MQNVDPNRNSGAIGLPEPIPNRRFGSVRSSEAHTSPAALFFIGRGLGPDPTL